MASRLERLKAYRWYWLLGVQSCLEHGKVCVIVQFINQRTPVATDITVSPNCVESISEIATQVADPTERVKATIQLIDQG